MQLQPSCNVDVNLNSKLYEPASALLLDTIVKVLVVEFQLNHEGKLGLELLLTAILI
jgi:hypothetical protein